MNTISNPTVPQPSLIVAQLSSTVAQQIAQAASTFQERRIYYLDALLSLMCRPGRRLIVFVAAALTLVAWAGAARSQSPGTKVKPEAPVSVFNQQRIVYEQRHSQFPLTASAQLYVMSSDGTGKTKIPQARGYPFTYVDPALSSDGSRIAFASDRSAPSTASGEDALDIFTMDLNGNRISRLTKGGGNSQPAWSRDGQRIAFRHTVSNELGKPGIYVIDGTAIRRLQTHTGSLQIGGPMWPTWSPDGSRILYTVNYSQGGTVYVYSFATPDKPGPSLMVTPSSSKPAWSPDGSKIAFQGLNDVISVINADGTGLRALTGHGLNSGDHDKKPAWSPDGKKIVFERYNSQLNPPYGSSNIFVVDASGSALSPLLRLTTGLYNGAPSWAKLSGPGLAPATKK